MTAIADLRHLHLAARAAGAASCGEVLVAETIVDLVEGSGIEFVDRVRTR